MYIIFRTGGTVRGNNKESDLSRGVRRTTSVIALYLKLMVWGFLGFLWVLRFPLFLHQLMVSDSEIKLKTKT